MNDKTLGIVKQLAKKLSIINVDNYVSFDIKNNISRDGKVFEQPRVRIFVEKLEAITNQEIDEKAIISELETSVDIID